jgi:hypothetical protein
MPDDLWTPLSFDEETAWLSGGSPGDSGAGFDQDGWEASVWIAHAMFELPGMDLDYTHDDARRARLAAGLEEPRILGNIDMDDASTLTGVQLGLPEAHSDDWRRVRWAEMASRTGSDHTDQKYPPCFRWFPYRSWPASIDPPSEGSLDSTSLRALCVQLVAENSVDACIAAYCLVASGLHHDGGTCFGGPVSEIERLVDPSEWRIGTPSNFWAVDRSWFVYTDWDLWGTKVSGPRSLIDRLVAEPVLETVIWPTPS